MPEIRWRHYGENLLAPLRRKRNGSILAKIHTGYTPTVWHYFRPQDGNPFVIAWLTVVLLTTCAYAWWVLFAGGAQKVRDLNLMAAVGQHRSKPQSLLSIKLFAAFGPLFFPIWLYLVVSMNAPLPK